MRKMDLDLFVGFFYSTKKPTIAVFEDLGMYIHKYIRKH